MASRAVMEKYARLAVVSGVNVQPGQMLVIGAAVADYEFVRMCIKAAYEAGAGYVKVNWNDEQHSLMNYEYASVETLEETPQWRYDMTQWEHDKGCCYLHIISETPGLFKDIDPQKVQRVQLAHSKKNAPLQKYTMNNDGQWSIVALPSAGWAAKVFPDMDEDAAIEALMNAILTSVRVREDNDPVKEWDKHNSEILEHCKKLNEYNFKALHFTNELGTDLTVELVKDHVWGGGCEYSSKGVIFNPNMPTEETFCMPLKTGVNGRVYASMPLNYRGKLIEDFWIEFKDGKAVDYKAAKEEETLKSLIEFDEGSCYLGEVALISYDSPIKDTGILFYETLFDENASCHLALGRAYPMNVKGGTQMSEEELAAAGANYSMTHVDFMFGSREMHVEGICHDGSKVTVFEHGNFAF